MCAQYLRFVFACNNVSVRSCANYSFSVLSMLCVFPVLCYVNCKHNSFGNMPIRINAKLLRIQLATSDRSLLSDDAK